MLFGRRWPAQEEVPVCAGEDPIEQSLDRVLSIFVFHQSSLVIWHTIMSGDLSTEAATALDRDGALYFLSTLVILQRSVCGDGATKCDGSLT